MAKKGCKRFRKVIIGRRSKHYADNYPRQIASGRTLWGIGIEEMNRVRIELNFGAWNIMCLEAGFKDFLFRLVHGKLYLNQIVANFADRRLQCTFCMIREKRQMRQAEWKRKAGSG